MRIHPQDRTERVQYRTRKDLKKADNEILWTDRIPQEKGSLRRIQEPEYRTEKIYL
jgi:hypothetical protein